MLTFPILFPRRSRGRSKLPMLPPPALALVGVEGLDVTGGQLSMNLLFNTADDNPMNDPSAADAAKWTARYQGTLYTGVLLAPVFLNTIFLLMDPVGPEAGADVLSYANAPSDISDSLGRFLAAFEGFPL